MKVYISKDFHIVGKSPFWWVRSFFRGIRNIFYYLPVVWRDRDWDHSYILELLRHKLKSVEAGIVSGRLSMGLSERHRQEIRRTVLLLDRIIADNYHENAAMFHTKRWGHEKIRFKDEGNHYFLDGWDYPNAHTPEEQKRAEWERDHRMASWTKSQEYDWEYFIGWIGKHMRGWWD